MKNAILLLSLLLSVGCVIYQTEMIPVSTIVVEPLVAADVDQIWLLETDEGSGSCFPVKCEIEAAGRLGEDAYLVWFLTTEHCVRDDVATRNCTSVSDGGGMTLDEVVRIESAPGLDLAVIVFRSPIRIKVRTLSFVPVKSGEWLVASGYVNGEIALPTLGLAGRSGSSSCQGYFGCSGGPVTRLDGSVVGVQSKILWDTDANFPITFCSFYVPIVDAEDWVREWLH